MTLDRTFSRGTTLTDAWRAAGVTILNARNAPWAAVANDGTIVLTLWRDTPHPDNVWTGRNLCDVRLRDESEETGPRIAKLREWNRLIIEACRSPARVIVLNWRRDSDGQFQPDQDGASMPVEIFTATVLRSPRKGWMRIRRGIAPDT